MIAGNFVKIRLPKIQSRKCLRKSNLWRYSRKCLRKFNSNEIRSPELSASTQGIFFFHDVWNIFFHFSLSYLWPFVGCGVFSLCNLLLSVSWAAPLKKQTGHWLRPFLCLNCFTNTLEYYRKNYRFLKAQNWS